MGRGKSHFAILAAVLCFSTAQAQTGKTAFALKDGDRVVFYGDSITAQRFYTRDVELFVLTRYPELNVDFSNAGVPGDRAWGGYLGDMTTRVIRDVGPYKPTVVTVMLGMNDAEYGPIDQKTLGAFEKSYSELLTRLHAAAAPYARFTLIGSSPYDEMSHGTQFPGYQETVARFSQAVGEMAQARHLPFVDFNTPVTETIRRGLTINPSYAALLIPDRIHPAAATQWVMAETLLLAWHADPVISRVVLDAASATSAATIKAEVSAIHKSPAGLAWTAREESLPLPMSFDDPLSVFAYKAGQLESMDEETLKITGLSAPQYELKIDGKAIATFTQAQLAAGVNLATLPTPMLDQARAVEWIEDRRIKQDAVRFDLISGQPVVPGHEDAVRVLQAASAIDLAEARKKAQPVSHTFELTAR